VSNPVTYAEGTLAVHKVYDDALDAHRLMDNTLTRANALLRRIHELKENIADREGVLLTDLRAAFAEVGSQEFQRIAKANIQADEELRGFRRSLASVENERDSALGAVRSLERRIEIDVARMHQLAGLLEFYAARAPSPTVPKKEIPPE
jgi:hypothetical protein